MLAWPFAARYARAAAPVRLDRAFPYAAYRTNDASAKLWLPERLEAALAAVSAEADASRPDTLRAELFVHVHGLHRLAELCEFARRDDGEELKASAKRSPGVAMLGKATEAFRLWLPRRLRDDVAGLAAGAGLGWSDYVRRLLVSRLLGQAFALRWEEAVGLVPAETAGWERAPD